MLHAQISCAKAMGTNDLKPKMSTYIVVVETRGIAGSFLGGSPGGVIFPVQMRQFRSNKWTRCSSVVSISSVLEDVLLSGRPDSTLDSACGFTVVYCE